jgi:hypothetical protein
MLASPSQHGCCRAVTVVSPVVVAFSGRLAKIQRGRSQDVVTFHVGRLLSLASAAEPATCCRTKRRLFGICSLGPRPGGGSRARWWLPAAPSCPGSTPVASGSSFGLGLRTPRPPEPFHLRREVSHLPRQPCRLQDRHNRRRPVERSPSPIRRQRREHCSQHDRSPI